MNECKVVTGAGAALILVGMMIASSCNFVTSICLVPTLHTILLSKI